jgi:predicted heme/steroid binding protein
MKKLIYFLLPAMIFTACEVEEMTYKDVNILPDPEIGAFGLTTVNSVSNYSEDTYKMAVSRTEGLSKTVEMEVVIDEMLVTDYNTLNGASYKVLPSDYYALPGKLTLEQNTKSDTINIVFKPAEMISELGQSELANYVIPVRLNPVGSVSSTETVLNSIIRFSFDDPTVKVTVPVSPYEFMFVSGVPVIRTLEIASVSNFTTLDLNRLSFVVSQEDVDAYNTANGTTYTLLPQSSYSIGGGTFDNGSLALSHTVSLDCGMLDPSNAYLLPVRMASGEYKIIQDAVIYAVITMTEIKISVTNPDRKVHTNKLNSHTELIEVKLNATLAEDVQIKLNYAPEKVNDYNAANGTSYSALNASALTLPAQTSIPTGTTSVKLNLGIDLSSIAYESDELLIPLTFDENLLVAGANLVNEVVYLRLKKSMFGQYDISGSNNYMNGRCQPNTRDLTSEYPYMNTYWTWDHGFQWKIDWTGSFNGDSTKKPITPWSSVTSGFTTQQMVDNVFDNASYFDTQTGNVYMIFKYYYNQSDKDTNKAQSINCILSNFRE